MKLLTLTCVVGLLAGLSSGQDEAVTTSVELSSGPTTPKPLGEDTTVTTTNETTEKEIVTTLTQLENTTLEEKEKEATTLNAEETSTGSEGSTPVPPAVSTSSPTTTTKKTTRTTTSPTTSKPDNSKGQDFNSSSFEIASFCSCDLTSGSCDLNCCCDEDCSKKDRRAFSGCSKTRPASLDPRFCYSEDYVFANNTQFQVEITSDNLFCILKDNSAGRSMLLDMEPIVNASRFDTLSSRHKRFLFPELSRGHFDPMSSSYRAGSPIWIERADSSVEALSFPQSLNGLECSVSNPLKFMEQGSSKCLYTVSDTRNGCEEIKRKVLASISQPFKVVSDPEAYFNRSEPETRQGLYLTDPEIFICSAEGLDEEACVKVAKVPAPDRSCKNLVAGVTYHIYHNGIQGIERVEMNIKLGNLGTKSRSWEQEFGYAHFWTTDNVTDALPRSGNPGYLDGKPILSGFLLYDEADFAWKIGTETLEQRRSLSLMPNTLTGDCFNDNTNDRLPIAFKENLRVGCSVILAQTDIARDCETLRNATLALLVGTADLEILTSVRVASFGNSDPDLPGDWVPVVVTDAPAVGESEGEASPRICPNIVLSSHVEIVHAAVGSSSNPQQKIIGVSVRFGPPQDIVARCLGQACSQSVIGDQRLEVFTSVGFVDATTKAVERVAELPALEVKLPYDFFYPFVDNSFGGEKNKASAAAGSRSSLLFLIVILSFGAVLSK